MPIAPENRKLYPPRKEWVKIRARILKRAMQCCECRGECGYLHGDPDLDQDDPLPLQCGTENGALVERWIDQAGHEVHAAHSHDNDCPGERCPGVRVVLTIAHLDHDPRNNDERNLRALCQRCHLRYDAEHHRRNAATTRARKRDEKTGQRRLL